MSTTTEPIAPAATMPEPEWIRVKQACEWTSMCKPTLYKLMAAGKVRFISLREHGTAKGTRLISFPSLKAFLESRAQGGEGEKP